MHVVARLVPVAICVWMVIKAMTFLAANAAVLAMLQGR